jgi:energy-coupling factor transporter ATP-binding protein EcfA2
MDKIEESGTEFVLRTDGLSKNYGAVTALDGLTLEVSRGEVLGYLGPNGAGKTTTIRLLLGLITASAGSAQAFGLDASAGPGTRDRSARGLAECLSISRSRPSMYLCLVLRDGRRSTSSRPSPPGPTYVPGGATCWKPKATTSSAQSAPKLFAPRTRGRAINNVLGRPTGASGTMQRRNNIRAPQHGSGLLHNETEAFRASGGTWPILLWPPFLPRARPLDGCP